jgi:hypothetical protein
LYPEKIFDAEFITILYTSFDKKIIMELYIMTSIAAKSDLNLLSIPLTGTSDKKIDVTAVLPVDIIRLIFAFAKEDLVNIARVNKQWKYLVYDNTFRQMLNEDFLDNKVYKKLGVEAQEPHLPLSIYRDVEPNDLVACVPETIEMGNKEDKLLTPKLIGELAAKHIKGLNKTGYTDDSWDKAIDEDRGTETSHWVWIKAKAVGISESYYKQEITAKNQGGSVSGFRDTLVCLFLERIKSGKPNFNWDGKTWIRVKDKIDAVRIIIGFDPSGLCFHYMIDRFSDYDVCVAVARKSIGT